MTVMGSACAVEGKRAKWSKGGRDQEWLRCLGSSFTGLPECLSNGWSLFPVEGWAPILASAASTKMSLEPWRRSVCIFLGPRSGALAYLGTIYCQERSANSPLPRGKRYAT
ncbi:12377_t:CDS:2 [Acaulospora colombiana]|uniref:12377_t:CDS:1 n=1 Tax=Acaulospora colombiana TaxID=27376 RepID=A0ACA9LPQ4_9GLOM|nr:12377_t:CDS:2 [Acaulospora colombiana]